MPRLSREAVAKPQLGANNKAATTSLTLPALLSSAKQVLCCEAKTKAPIGANSEVTTTSPKSRALQALSREAKIKAPLGDNNEAIAASLKVKALVDSA